MRPLNWVTINFWLVKESIAAAGISCDFEEMKIGEVKRILTLHKKPLRYCSSILISAYVSLTVTIIKDSALCAEFVNE